MIALSQADSLRPTHEQSSKKKSGRSRESLGDAHSSATPTPPESMRPAARHFAGGRTTPSTPAFFSFPRPRPRPLLALPRLAPATPGARDFRPSRQQCRCLYHHQSSTCLRASVINFPRRFPVKGVSVSTNDHNRIAHFVLVHHFVGLCFCLLDPVSIVTVDNIVRILVVMTPQGGTCPDPRRSQSETKVLVLHGGLHVGTDRCDRRHHLTKLQLEEDRNLSSSLKPNHQDPRHSLSSPTACAPEPDALVAGTDVRIILAGTHTTWNVKALLADGHQFRDTTISPYYGARTRASSSPTRTSRSV